MEKVKGVFPLNDDKSPKVEGSWQNYKGKANTPMVGVPIPDEIIVLDIDLYKGVTCEEVDAALGCSLGWDEAELQETANGGRHYAFRVAPGLSLKNGVDVLKVKGFDTRAAGKGYIATGEGYDSLCFIDVVEALADPSLFPWLPAGALEKLENGSVIETDDDLLSLVASQPLDLEDGELEMYMSKLTAEHARDSWLDVMFATYHQTGGSEEGWRLFDEFSLMCPEKYDERKNRARWESCGKNKSANPVTFASVINLVGGRSAVETDKFELLKTKVLECDDKTGLGEIVKELSVMNLNTLNRTLITKALAKRFSEIYQEKFTEPQIRKILKGQKRHDEKGNYFEDYIFLTCKGEYMHRESKAVMPGRSFDVKHNRDTPPDQDGYPQSACVYVSNRIECAHDGMYAPSFNDVFTYSGIDYFNTYKPTQLERVENGQTDIVDRILGHIAHLLPKKDEQQLVINYLAHNVQFPGKKIQWAMILQGVEGDGKSFLAEMMKHVLGEYNCRTVTVESLDEKFTGWAEGNCMVFIEELKLDNYKKYETLNKLKPYIANPTVPVRKMGRDVYEAINTTNYFALTNFKDALPIGDNDRRYCVVFSQWQDKEKLMQWMSKNQGYYSNLYDDMRENAGEILDYLLSHKIPDSFLGLNRAPETAAKQQMISIAKSDDFLLVEDAIEQFNCWDINEHVINITKLQREVDQCFESDFSDFPKRNRLKNILLDMGFHNIGRYKTKDERKNQTIYCKDDSKKASDFSEDAEKDYVPF